MNDRAKVTLLAHRGASHAAPENTLAAFARALGDEGADGLECDVRLSADGVPVVFHDNDLMRMTGAAGKLEATPAAELARLLVAGQEPLPTLADLVVFLAQRPSTIINVELKPSPRPKDLASACLPHLQAMARHHTLVVSSFDPRALRLLADAGLSGRLALLFDDPAALRALPLLPPVDLHPGAGLVDASALASWARVAPAAVLRTWTVDDPTQALALMALGVTTFITNRPGPLRAELRARHETT